MIRKGRLRQWQSWRFPLVSGEGLEEIEFENGKYIYLPYYKVTMDNAEAFLNNSGN